MPGVFVSNAAAEAIENPLAFHFCAIEYLRKALEECDDGSLDVQIARLAARTSMIDLVHALDKAGLLGEASQFPQAPPTPPKIPRLDDSDAIPGDDPNAAREIIVRPGIALMRYYQQMCRIQGRTDERKEGGGTTP